METDRLHFVPKGWGFEKWIVNNDKYCGKILYFVKDRQCSLHYHKLKDETFYVQSGKVKVFYSPLNEMTSISRCFERVLHRGDHFHIPVGLVHRILALEDSEIFEFSTTHYDSDSYRLEKGD